MKYNILVVDDTEGEIKEIKNSLIEMLNSDGYTANITDIYDDLNKILEDGNNTVEKIVKIIKERIINDKLDMIVLDLVMYVDDKDKNLQINNPLGKDILNYLLSDDDITIKTIPILISSRYDDVLNNVTSKTWIMSCPKDEMKDNYRLDEYKDKIINYMNYYQYIKINYKDNNILQRIENSLNATNELIKINLSVTLDLNKNIDKDAIETKIKEKLPKLRKKPLVVRVLSSVVSKFIGRAGDDIISLVYEETKNEINDVDKIFKVAKEVKEMLMRLTG